MHSARSMTLSRSVSLSQAAQAAHARRFKPLPTLRRDSAGAPYPTKALGKLPASSASKPGTGKQRAGDTFEIDLLSGVITTTATTVRRNKRHHNGEGELEVRSTKFFRKTRKNDLPSDLAPQETKPATSRSSSQRSSGRQGGKD